MSHFEKAQDLAFLLRSGMDSEFERQFRKTAEDINVEGLALMVNENLRSGDRKTDLRVVVSLKNRADKNSISVVGGSRFFGESWPVLRKTFSV